MVLTGKDRDGSSLGPTPTVEVLFEGVPTRALLDTGSPVTIVSLNFVLQALAKQRKESQTPAEWEQEVKPRLSTPKPMLQNYGGGNLDVIRQTSANISRENYACNAMVMPFWIFYWELTCMHHSVSFCWRQDAMGEHWTCCETRSGKSQNSALPNS